MIGKELVVFLGVKMLANTVVDLSTIVVGVGGKIDADFILPSPSSSLFVVSSLNC